MIVRRTIPTTHVGNLSFGFTSGTAVTLLQTHYGRLGGMDLSVNANFRSLFTFLLSIPSFRGIVNNVRIPVFSYISLTIELKDIVLQEFPKKLTFEWFKHQK